MNKKCVLALIFCGIMLFSFSSCAVTPPADTSSSQVLGSGTEGEHYNTDAGGTESSFNSSGVETDLPSDTVPSSSSQPPVSTQTTADKTDTKTQTDGGTHTATDTGTDTESSATSTTPPPATPMILFDASVDHKVIMDNNAKEILVVDFDKGSSPEDWSLSSASVVWKWSTDDAAWASGSAKPKIKGKTINMDSVKYRYSSYYKKDVIVFCGSSGWVGIVDYASKKLLFEDNPGFGPHSVELLPNGDLVLACSDNGGDKGQVLYYPLSAGQTKASSSVPLDSGHGICYDPQEDILWALGDAEIVGLKVKNSGRATASLETVPGRGTSFNGAKGGHVISPIFGNPGCYWVSTSSRIWVFSSRQNTVSPSLFKASYYTNGSVKGIAYFPDGTMIQTAHNQGGTGTYRSASFRVLYRVANGTKEEVKSVMIPHIQNDQTYKVHVFTKDYQ